MAQANPKYLELTDRINELLSNEEEVDEFTIRSLYRDSSKLDPAFSHAINGMIACVDADYENAKKSHIKSFDYDSSSLAYEQFTVSLVHLGQHFEALEIAEAAYELFPGDLAALSCYINTVIGALQVQKAYELLSIWKQLSPKESHPDEVKINRLREFTHANSITDDELLPLINVFSDICLDNKLYIRGTTLSLSDEDNNLWCDLIYYMRGNVEQAVEFNIAFAEEVSKILSPNVMEKFILKFTSSFPAVLKNAYKAA